MALLDGMLGGAQSVMAFGQQQFENKLAKDKFAEQTRQYDQNYALQQKQYGLNERATVVSEDSNTRAKELQPGLVKKQELENDKSQFDLDGAVLKRRYTDNDRAIGDLISAGFINVQGEYGPTRLDINNSVKLITAGGAVNDKAILGMANRDQDLPEGFTLNKVDRTPNGLVLRGTYEDGRQGVLTAEGSVGDDDAVAFLSPQQLAGLMDDEYRTNIRGNSNLGASSATVEYLVGQGMAEADAVEVVNRETAQNTLQTQVVGELNNAAEDPATGDGKNVGMVRAFKAALASAETDEDKLQILTDQAQAFGIKVPEILSTPSPVKGEDPVKTRLAEAGLTAEKWAQLTDEQKQEAIDVLNIRDGLKTVGKWVASPLAPAADAVLAYPKAIGNVAKAFANSKVGKALGLSEVGDEPGYYNKTAFIDAQRQAMAGKPDITVDQANTSFTAIPNQPAEAQRAAQELEAGVFARLNEMTPEEAVAFVDDNNLVVTPEDEKKLTTVLQSAGVQTAADINKLPSKAQVNVRSWLRSMAIQRGDNAAAEKLRGELLSLGSGSGRADATALDMQKLSIEQQNANSSSITAASGASNAALNISKHNLAVEQHFLALDKFSSELSTANRKAAEDRADRLKRAIYGEDDGVINDSINYDKNKLFQTVGGVGGVFGQAYSAYDKASGPEKRGLEMELNTIISSTFQALAESEEYGKFSENFFPDGSIDSIDGSDVWSNRLIVTERDKDGRPARFGVVDLSSRQQVDETISASDIKNLFGARGYNYIVKRIK
jgi:hypothetical protein